MHRVDSGLDHAVPLTAGHPRAELPLSWPLQSFVEATEGNQGESLLLDVLLMATVLTAAGNRYQCIRTVDFCKNHLMRKDALMRIGHSEDNAGDDLFPIDSFMEKAEKTLEQQPAG